MASVKAGDYVAWQWAGSYGHGTVESLHPERTEIYTRGAHIRRNGSQDDPAVIIRDHNGTKVLKLAHELHLAAVTRN